MNTEGTFTGIVFRSGPDGLYYIQTTEPTKTWTCTSKTPPPDGSRVKFTAGENGKITKFEVLS